MTIKKVDGEFCVFNEEGTKNLGCFPTQGEAEARLVEIEIFKKQRDDFTEVLAKSMKGKD